MATSVAAPLERQFGRIAGVTEMTSTSYRGSTSITLAVRSEPQYQRSGPRRPGGHQCRPGLSAGQSAQQPDLPQGQPGRCAHPDHRPHLGYVTTAQMYDAASSIMQQKLSQVEGVGQVFVGGSSLPAVRVDLNPTALNKYGISLEDVRGVLAGPTSTGQRAVVEREEDLGDPDQRSAPQGRAVSARDRHLPVRCGRAAPRCGKGDRIRWRTCAPPGLVNGKPAVMVIIFRQPGANIIETVDRVRALLPHLEAAMPGGVKVSVVSGPYPPDPGLLERCGDDALSSRPSW